MRCRQRTKFAGNFPPDEAVEIILNNLNNQQPTELQQLEANFRNTKEIFEFARGFVPEDDNVQNIDTTELDNGENPEILDNLGKDAQLSKIKEIIEANPTSNIGILVNFRNQVTDIKNYLESQNYSCKSDAPDNLSFSYYFNGMPYQEEAVMFNKMKTPFIVTYDSCKGLEFDIVIMPFFNDAANALNNQRRSKEADGSWVYETNIDGSPKMWATPNHYYVGATRARTQLFVLCSDRPNILDFHDDNLNNPNEVAGDDLPF